MPSVLRILDANANRAREAMRVMEESARFVLGDSALTLAIKHLRHDLTAALSQVQGLEDNRDTPGDVGTAIHTESEYSRASVADVAIAAGKRLSESLRAIEEFGKALSITGFAATIESLRYRGYDIEQKLNRAMATGRARQWKLCVLLTASLCANNDWLRVAASAVEGGADCLQLREKNIEAGDLLERARQLVALCRPRGASVIINDRPDVALLSGADGVHLGQTDLPCEEVRKLVGRQLLIGVSTSSVAQARLAIAAGADYCGVGPMFNTTTKHKDVIVGPSYLREFISELPNVPHLAIGGITADNIAALVAVGVRGVAVSSAVCAATDPASTARSLVQAITRTREIRHA